MTVPLNFYYMLTIHVHTHTYKQLSLVSYTMEAQQLLLATKMQLLLLILLLASQLSGGETTSCPNTSATADTKPLYLLTLASIPDGLRALSEVRIAHKS